jgi:hypothetical protein
VALRYRCQLHGTTAEVEVGERSVRITPRPPNPGLRHFPQCDLALVAAMAFDDPDAPLAARGPVDPRTHAPRCRIEREV